MDTTPTSVSAADESERVRVRVPAKVNLALCVGGVGEDGFHPLATVFQALSLFDEVVAETAGPGQFTLTVTGDTLAGVPTDDSNLAVRAARLLAQRHGSPDLGVRLHLRKAIPVAGGMAGGSADAAGALLACSVLWDLDTAPDDLHTLAAELGSDVPFGLVGGVAIGRGRGDQLVPVLSRGTYHWVLALAHDGLSTPSVFRRFDEMDEGRELAVPPALTEALAKGDAAALGRALRNDLQAPALDLRPELAETLAAGTAAGALGAIVSGSGPTCAFLAADEASAMDIAAALVRQPTVAGVRRATGPVHGATLLG